MEDYQMARMLRDSQLGTIGGDTSEVLCEIISKMIIDAKAYKAAVPHQENDDLMVKTLKQSDKNITTFF